MALLQGLKELNMSRLAYGRLLAERGKEQAAERERYERELALAEKRRRQESERKAGWGLGLSAIGGALFGPIGLVAGKALGSYIGENASTILGQTESEKYKVSTDVGRFGVSQKHELEDVNRLLQSADAADIAQTWKDIGTTALTAFTMGGGSLKDPSNFSFTKFGGKDATTGMGLFNIGGGGEQSLWNQYTGGKMNWFPRKSNTFDSFDTDLDLYDMG